MSSNAASAAADAPNRCDVVDTHADETKDPLNLHAFMSKLTAEQELRRAADYVADPRAYLQKALGKDTFAKREQYLSLPEKHDKDIYGNGEHKTHFQSHIAKLLGKSHGLFFLTGVQAQLTAMRIYCERAGNRRTAWHETSHLEDAEQQAYQHLHGMQRRLIGESRDRNPSVGEIEELCALPEEERPAALVLEIPNRVLGCATYPFADLEKISETCKKAGVKLHCDGARLWEIEPYYQRTAGKTFSDIGTLFDSVYVSFYKGMRGATGAILASNDESFIQDAKTWQRRAGGNAFTLFFEVIDCERGYNENIGTFEAKWKKMEDIANGVKAATAKYKTRNGNPIIMFQPEDVTCCQTRTIFQGCSEDEIMAARDKVIERVGVKVFTRLWPKKSLDEQTEKEREQWMKTGKTDSSSVVGEPSNEDEKHAVEWMIVQSLYDIDTKLIVEAFTVLCEEVLAQQKSS